MREIKFRGVTHEFSSPSWVYGDLICNSTDEPRIMDDYHDCYEPTTWIVDPETVGQFTGRCASESAEIFEGDVLEYTVFDYQGQDVQYRGVVEWCGSRFIVSVCLVLASNKWREKRDYEESYYNLDWLLDQDDEVKIIGNIHDNPELLEVEA